MAAPTTEAIRHRWNNFAESYGEELAPFLTQVGISVVTSLRLKEATSILEVGCGTGTVTQLAMFYKPKDTKIVATDLSEAMVAIAKKRFEITEEEKEGDELRVQVANAEELPFPDASFDRYFANLCIMMVSDTTKALSEARRVLKPGSTAAFSVWGRREVSPFMTIIPQALAELEIPIPAHERSNFHLGDLEHFKNLAVQAGFKSPIAWYSSVSFDVRTPEEFVEKHLKLWTTQLILKNIPSTEQQTALWENVKMKVQKYLETGTPLLFDTAVLVVSV